MKLPGQVGRTGRPCSSGKPALVFGPRPPEFTQISSWEESPVTCHRPPLTGPRSRAVRPHGRQAQHRPGEGAAQARGSQNTMHISLLQSGKEVSSAVTVQLLILLNENKVQKRKYSPNFKGINHLNIMTIHIIYLKLLIIVISAFNTNMFLWFTLC